MPAKKRPTEQERPTEDELARMWHNYMHEHEQFNARLNLFLIAEAMLVVAATQVLTSDRAKPLLGLGISVTGIALTLAWAYVNWRQTNLVQFRRNRAIRYMPEFAKSNEERPKAPVGSTHVLAYGVPAIVLVVWLWILVASIVDVE